MPWYFFALASALLLTTLSLVEKRLLFRVHSMDYSAAVAFVNALCSLPLLFFVDLSKVDPYPVAFLAFATALSVPAFLLTTKGVRHLEISTAEPFMALGPGISALLAFIVLHEKLALHQTLGIVFAIAGMYVLETKPHISIFESFRLMFRSRYIKYILYALLIYGVTSLVDRVILNRYDMDPIAYIIFAQIFIAFHFFIVSLMVGDGSAAIVRGISKARWLILLTAVLMTLSRIMQATAIKMAPLGLALTVKRTSVLFITVIGGELFHEKNLLRKTIAALIIVAGSLLIVL